MAADDGGHRPVPVLADDGGCLPVPVLADDGGCLPVPVLADDGGCLPVPVLVDDGGCRPVPVLVDDGGRRPVPVLVDDGGCRPVPVLAGRGRRAGARGGGVRLLGGSSRGAAAIAPDAVLAVGAIHTTGAVRPAAAEPACAALQGRRRGPAGGRHFGMLRRSAISRNHLARAPDMIRVRCNRTRNPRPRRPP
ncbi:hypothetical protein LNKW23_15680 [Paralimibaculum aggregatum]|uniref:Uncharacterized protein n=1 Tax=Paralimibaculum aggregatum TaxID=3036245 RepID=A0ABQ6LJE3_9RHOB|nr:hypothetical protein [Limibaculum sp. NKW23]GMG82355.1 hypothetical protein LNKW23_15680 [Limibaculum sp. NKW23]